MQSCWAEERFFQTFQTSGQTLCEILMNMLLGTIHISNTQNELLLISTPAQRDLKPRLSLDGDTLVLLMRRSHTHALPGISSSLAWAGMPSVKSWRTVCVCVKVFPAMMSSWSPLPLAVSCCLIALTSSLNLDDPNVCSHWERWVCLHVNGQKLLKHFV